MSSRNSLGTVLGVGFRYGVVAWTIRSLVKMLCSCLTVWGTDLGFFAVKGMVVGSLADAGAGVLAFAALITALVDLALGVLAFAKDLISD